MRHYLHDLATAFPDFWVEASRPSRRTACCSDRPPSRVGARSCPPLPHPPRPQVDQYATVDTGSITVMYHGSATNLGEYHHHKPTRHTSTFQGE
jgi:hypothetical protein